jgi:hypothetical protein
MKAKEIIMEIDATSELKPEHWDKNDLENAVLKTKYDGYDILELKNPSMTFYIIVEEEKLLAFVGINKTQNNYFSLERIKNNSKIKGLATKIIEGLLQIGMKFVIKNTEALTPSGKDWLISLIKNVPEWIKIVNQNGEVLNTSEVEIEWIDAMMNEKSGPTSVYMEKY